jgi:hypothetical protein
MDKAIDAELDRRELNRSRTDMTAFFGVNDVFRTVVLTKVMDLGAIALGDNKFSLDAALEHDLNTLIRDSGIPEIRIHEPKVYFDLVGEEIEVSFTND